MADNETISTTEMRQWLRDETQNLMKAVQLRLQDAQEFVTDYAAGKLTAEKAMSRLSAYDQRWGDSPLPGLLTTEGKSDEEILRQIDSLPSHAAKAKRKTPPRDRTRG